MRLFAGTASNPVALATAVPAAARAVEPTIPPPTVQTFRDHVSLARLPPRIVLVDTLWLVGVGIACGAPLVLGAALLMGPFLMSPPFDPVPLLGVPALLAVCAILAGHFPARRASRQDPAVVLRST
jgi:hypothetical protein